MKIWYKFFAVIVAMALVTGCSKDDLGDDDITPGGSKDVAYMSVSVALPSAKGTRSTTGAGGGSSSGTETGQDRENNVRKILVGARQYG